MMMKMMNCFCDMANRWKALSLISSRDHYQRSSPSEPHNFQQATEPMQNLSSDCPIPSNLVWSLISADEPFFEN